MDSLAKLFQLLEITRSQPLYGLALANVQKHNLSDLAQHHYLVTIIAWQIGAQLEEQGVAVNFRRLLEICLIHDLGELFGGDISMAYARANPKAKKAAKQFEMLNQEYLSNYFGSQKEYINSLFSEAMEPESLEAVISKVADYMEVTHHKIYIKAQDPTDIVMMKQKLQERITILKDRRAIETLQKIVETWLQDLTALNAEPFSDAKVNPVKLDT